MCEDLHIIPINPVDHNKMINDEINELQSRIIGVDKFDYEIGNHFGETSADNIITAILKTLKKYYAMVPYPPTDHERVDLLIKKRKVKEHKNCKCVSHVCDRKAADNTCMVDDFDCEERIPK